MKTALVTGASRGLGAEIVKQLLSLGYYVAKPTREELDVSSGASVSSYELPWDHLDVLVNNAAIVDGTLYDVMETNAYGPYRLTKHLWPMLAKVKGRVVNISSREGCMDERFGHRPYSVSKSTLTAISKMMSANQDEVTVVSCCPGWFRSRLGGEQAPRSAEQAAKSIVWITHPDRQYNGKFLCDAGALQY